MPADLYVRRNKKPVSRFKIAFVSLTIVLALAAILYGLLKFNNQQNALHLKADFILAMQSENYVLAMQIYRKTQELAVLPQDSQQPGNLYRNLQTELEQTIDQQLEVVESNLLAGKSLSEENRALITGLSEVSSLRLNRFVDRLILDELTGLKRTDDTIFILNQLKNFESISEEIEELSDQLPAIINARSSVKSAQSLLDQNDWLNAYEAWQILAESPEQAQYVQEYSRQKLQVCKTAMYQPLLDIALQDLDQNRIFTAQKRLLELQPIYSGDRQIDAALELCDELIPAKLENYRSTVEHLTVKPLIVRSDLAFDGDIYAGAAYDTLITTAEFKNLLNELYQNQYILVDQSRLLPSDGESFGILLPAGKKPLVLILEGFNYYVSRRETGNCWNLVLDANNQVSGQYQNESGELVIDRQAEAIGILDLFVAEHPDFSYDGAKGLITLTGYEGVFGYITDPDQLDDRNQALIGNGYPALSLQPSDYEKNRQTAAAIIDQLKNTGWQFGTSTYAFLPVASASLEAIQADWQKWQLQVAPLTGPVLSLHFPNGGLLSFGDERSLFYQSQGIQIFSGLGAAPYISRRDQLVYVDKVQISGYSIEHPGFYRLERLFDASKVIDRDVLR